MKVALLASEVVPFAKTGGLADVAGALPKFLNQLGVEVKIFLPLYRETRKKGFVFQKAGPLSNLEWAGEKSSFSVWERKEGSLSYLFIQKDEYFDRDFLYGTPQGDYPDNGERFAFFCRAVLEALRSGDFSPDIIHCHDWQAAMALAYLKFSLAEDPFFARTRSLFTVHNLAYQGLFEREILRRIGLPDFLFNMEDLEFYGQVNYLKAGLLYSTAVNTVSPRYSQEIQRPEFGYRLDGLLTKRRASLFGILNGVDYADWDPSQDRFLIKSFDSHSLQGKAECKKDLLETFSLQPADPDSPIVGMVSRLAGQKGFDILCQALDDIFETGVSLVILGTGEAIFQDALRSAQKKYPRQLGLRIAFDEALSHKIYAGSDMFLIPSRYEPCGLTQMYSLRYGTIPVVRATGGLADTVEEFDLEKGTGNGFRFEDYSPAALVSSLRRAVAAYRRQEKWRCLIRNAMACDFSWERSAREYGRLYEKIIAF